MQTRDIDAKRIVVKIGTSSLINPNGTLNLRTIDQLAFVLSTLCGQDKQVILVSSGAIGAGLGELHLTKRPDDISAQQALAAIGQSKLLTVFNQRFDHYNQQIGQMLLTHDVFDFPSTKENAMNTFDRLLERHVVPIVNENDSVAVDELDHKTTFGDNDQLSAMVAKYTNADLLIMLTDTDGFYDGNPLQNPMAQLLPQITTIDETTYAVAGGKGSRYGTGGMVTKLKAAEIVMAAGQQMVLANGSDPSIIFDILDGKPVGTWFAAQPKGALKNG